MERKRIDYIDWLRIISALAVIGIHITMTQPNNYSVQEIGKDNYIILTCVYTLIQWAVPVFLMISGNLLLHSNKITFAKIKKMTIRMGTVLILFGSAFALLEQVFERKTLKIGMLPNSILLTLQQKSWSHLWYLYVLIGIYLILIPLKRFVEIPVIRKSAYSWRFWLQETLLFQLLILPLVQGLKIICCLHSM